MSSSDEENEVLQQQLNTAVVEHNVSPLAHHRRMVMRQREIDRDYRERVKHTYNKEDEESKRAKVSSINNIGAAATGELSRQPNLSDN